MSNKPNVQKQHYDLIFEQRHDDTSGKVKVYKGGELNWHHNDGKKLK
jgi:mitochondrial fission protein ELM1